MVESREGTTGHKVIDKFLSDHPDVPIQPTNDSIAVVQTESARTGTDAPAPTTKDTIQKVEVEPPPARILITLYTDPLVKHIRKGGVGMVFEITSGDDDVVRGPSSKKTSLFPPMYLDATLQPKRLQDRDQRIARHRLALVGTVVDSRNYILAFKDKENKESWVQVQAFTHTSVQIYTVDQWDNAISKIDAQRRGFKVALGLRFQSHVIAFLSYDNLFRVSWAESRLELPVQKANVYPDFEQFLVQVCDWALKRRGGRGCLKPVKRPNNALHVIRECDAFHGVGVYTATEIFHLAGICPTISEGELFDSPSRFARLCAAYYEFARAGHFEVWDFVQQHMQEYVVAATVDDRKKYAEFLHVYGKDRTYLSTRQCQLLDIRNRMSKCNAGCYDPFEPELIKHALTLDKCNLGTLIFGAELWKTLSTAAGLPESTRLNDNPLSMHFKRNNIKGIDHPLSKAWRPTFCFRLLHGEPKDVWTLFQEPGHSNDFEAVLGADRKALLLSVKTQHTNLQTVGPLDFCCTARVVGNSGNKIMLVCEGDPRTSDFFVTRRILEKETVKLKRKGTEHLGVKEDVKRRCLNRFFGSSVQLDGATPGPFKRIPKAAEAKVSQKIFQRWSADRGIANSLVSTPSEAEEAAQGPATRSQTRSRRDITF
ncbi:hypothetical protein CVT26_003956 [Gymnopilus dilepis]|uniref:Uncharacterized protein n=1 Tax=Gymnopilus dilepis TaxID=231916 RepID=A0A409WTQ5_9AGAR|nr:hypothetical protein CVT26_003956 [Gymnopilus dilepis]